MDLYQQFNGALCAWIAYCKQPSVQCSSDPASVTCCDAYERIRKLGHPALPLILDIYGRKGDAETNGALETIKSFGLVALVQSIAGPRFRIPENLSGRREDIKEFTKIWLDDNIEYYVSQR